MTVILWRVACNPLVLVFPNNVSLAPPIVELKPELLVSCRSIDIITQRLATKMIIDRNISIIIDLQNVRLRIAGSYYIINILASQGICLMYKSKVPKRAGRTAPSSDSRMRGDGGQEARHVFIQGPLCNSDLRHGQNTTAKRVRKPRRYGQGAQLYQRLWFGMEIKGDYVCARLPSAY